MKSDVYTPYVDLVQLITALNITSESDWITTWPTVIDSHSHLREIVVEVATGDHDAYGFSANNYLLYHSTTTTLFQYMPQDLDESWGLDNDGGLLNMAAINVYRFVISTQNDLQI
jgi:spore coat protein CotH